MKKCSIIAAVVVVLTVVSGPAARAETTSFPCGDGATYSVLLPQGVLLDGKNCTGTLVIDNSVKIIDESAFSAYNCTNTCTTRLNSLTAVILPNSVTSIGAKAFQGTKLESVVIPNSVTKIGERAFEDTPLTSVIIPESVTYIGEAAFNGSKIRSVTLPNSITSISRFTFRMTSLTSITIPNSVTKIEDLAFEDTPLQSVTIGNSVTSIGRGSFKGTKLKSLVIPNSVTNIESEAFALTKLESVVIGDSVNNIGSFAFRDTLLTSLTIPKSLSMDCSVVSGVLTLTTISLPDSFGGGCNFERNYSLVRIEYCGKSTSFPFSPVCSPQRQALSEAEKTSVELKEKQMAEERVKVAITIKKTTITCIKGKVTKKVTAVKPKCPSGYKKK